jgi:DHA1 family multidrug resistance protein-like MFS transporter
LPSDQVEEFKSHTEDVQKELQDSTWTQVKSLLSPAMTTAFLMIFCRGVWTGWFLKSIYSLYVNEVHQFGLGAIATVLTLNGIISLILQVFFF